ncbi:MAG: hypothetical protein GXO15_01025 [Crenarchaeota archaeon]|nr:hypothetical protein [Thermoproteota archaeon]
MAARVPAGLVVAAVLGAAVALFPLYGKHLQPYLWSYNPNAVQGAEEEYTITARVAAVNPARMEIVVDHTAIAVRGYWIVVREGGGEERLWAEDLLARYIRPGMEVTIKYKESGRWGRVATEIEGPGFRAYTEEG